MQFKPLFHLPISDMWSDQYSLSRNRKPASFAEISPVCIATQRISVGSQIGMREAKERPELHNLHTDHVMIRWELNHFIGAKVVETVILNRGPVRTHPQTRWVPLHSGSQPGLESPVQFQTRTVAG